MPSPSSGSPNMPLPDLTPADSATFKTRLATSGAQPDDVEDRRGDAPMDDMDKTKAKLSYLANRKAAKKQAVASTDDKLASDAGYNDIGRMSREQRMKNRYASE